MIICADGLTGMKEAISAAFPNTQYQRCIVHQVRNTLKYVSHKDMKEFAGDLKKIYLAADESKGKEQLDKVTEKWHSKYPNSMKSWHNNWNILSPIYKFSSDVRKIIYTTNAIEIAHTRSLTGREQCFQAIRHCLSHFTCLHFKLQKSGLNQSETGVRHMVNLA